MPRAADMVWFFAYGSNMKSSVMERRGITPLAVQRLCVPSHVRTFDVFGAPFSEPAMASIAERGAAMGVGSPARDKQESNAPERGNGYLLFVVVFFCLGF